MKKLNVLMITPFFPPDRGGIANHVFNLSRNLANPGNNLSLITPKRHNNRIAEYGNHFSKIYELNTFNFPGWPYRSLTSINMPKDFGSKIKSIIRNGDFDLVHVHGHHYPFSWYAVKSATKFGVPSILTLHGTYALNPKENEGNSMIEELFNKYYFKKILLHTKAVIGLTKTITNYARIFGNPSLKYFTIPNGVDADVYKDKIQSKNEFRRYYNIDVNSIVILFCGRFEHVKGIIEFVRAINQSDEPNVEYLIVGDGSIKEKVHALSEKNPKIHLFPWQNENEINKFYLASDIFILPSKFEALPLTILEAMNASLHIVSTRVGGIEEILKPYNAKTYLENVSVNEIAKVLLAVIGNIETVDESSMNYAQGFDWKFISKRILKVYAEITD